MQFPELTPESPPGPLKWQMPDGMNAERAQRIMRAFVEYTHSVPALCSELQISTIVAEVYLQNACQIPKGIVPKLARLTKIMRQAPRKMRECFVTADAKGAPVLTKADEKILSFVEQNKSGQVRFAEAIVTRRKALGLSRKQVCHKLALGAEYLAKIEAQGATPLAKPFFKLCEFYHIDPEIFDWVGACEKKVRQWRTSRGEKWNGCTAER